LPMPTSKRIWMPLALESRLARRADGFALLRSVIT